MCTLYAMGFQCGLLWALADPCLIPRLAQGSAQALSHDQDDQGGTFRGG